MMMKEQELKGKVIETLKTKGYHESQLNELNPIIQATIDATKQALNLHIVSNNEVAVCNCGLKQGKMVFNEVTQELYCDCGKRIKVTN